MGTDNRELPIDKTVGDAVRGLIRRRWKNNAAKMVERTWDVDPKTARNIVGSGHVSERTLTKAIRAEGWDFLSALGEELTGQTYAEHLNDIIERESHVQKQREAERDRVRRLQDRASELGHLLDRPAA